MYLPKYKKISAMKALLLSFFFLLSFSLAYANGHEKSEGERAEKFNAGELIIEHVTDAHEWHIAGHLAIPLPVILYSPEKGLSVFSSSRFEEGAVSYEGY